MSGLFVCLLLTLYYCTGKYIAMSVYTVGLTCAITVPVTYVYEGSDSDLDFTFSFISIAIILCNTIVLCLVFVPKVCTVYHIYHTLYQICSWFPPFVYTINPRIRKKLWFHKIGKSWLRTKMTVFKITIFSNTYIYIDLRAFVSYSALSIGYWLSTTTENGCTIRNVSSFTPRWTSEANVNIAPYPRTQYTGPSGVKTHSLQLTPL